MLEGRELELPSTLHTRSSSAYTLWLSFCIPGVQFGLGLRLHSSCLDWRMNSRYYGETEYITESLSILSVGCGEDVEERSCPQAQNTQMWALLGCYFVSWPHVSKLTVTCQVLFSHHLGLIPGLGRSPGEGKGYPLQYSGLENSMHCISMGSQRETTERLSLSPSNWHSGELFLPVCPLSLEESCTPLAHQDASS